MGGIDEVRLGEGTPLRSSSVTVSGGRSLSWTEWGDPDGIPVIYQPHLGISGERNRTEMAEAWALGRVRLITVARAGLGLSDRRPGRDSITDGSDTAAVADALGLERVNLVGQCGGSGAVLAFAAGYPARVATLTLASPSAPLAGPGADAYLSSRLRTMRGYLRFGPVARLMARSQAKAFRRDPDRFLDRAWSLLPQVDRDIVADPLVRAGTRDEMGRILSPPFPFLDEWRALIGPWKFDMSAVRAHVVIDHGALDTTAPVAMARWLAAQLPEVELEVDPKRGHFMDPAKAMSFVAGIAERARSAAAAADGSAAGG